MPIIFLGILLIANYWGDHSNIFRADTLDDLLKLLPKQLFHILPRLQMNELYCFRVKSAQKLNMNDKQDLEKEITLAECHATLRNMKNNTSPGADGLTVEFYNFVGKI
jgi:hypothetical protein